MFNKSISTDKSMYKNTQIFATQTTLKDYLEGQKKDISLDLGKMSAGDIAVNDEAAIVKDYVNKYTIEPLKLDDNKKQMEHFETKVDVSGDPMRNPFRDKKCFITGLSLMLTIPYTGESYLWKLQPDTFNYSNTNRLKNVVPQEDERGVLQVEFEYIQDEAQKEQIESDIQSEITTINTNLGSQRTQLSSYNRELEGFVSRCIKIRKNELKKTNELLESLSIPIKPRKGMPDLKAITVKKRLVPSRISSAKPVAPEPGIDERIFQDILTILRFMGRTFEETAKTFAKLGEEDLRNVFLAALNGYFEGEVSGEVFRKSGKTDICIKEGEGAAFVAECKIWKGKESVLKALDQLLGYLTWRDCKASIIVFNKGNVRFSKILTDIPLAIREHDLFEKELGSQIYEGEWRFIVKHANDPGRKIILHVFAFDV